MADASEMLRDAQYALQNVSHGSTDSKKFAAQAKSTANRVIRKFPNSKEADSARSILRQLGERVPLRKTRNVHGHSVMGNRLQQHQAETHRESTGLNVQDAIDTQFASVMNQHLLPGWPLRLMQAVSVLGGLVLLLRGLNGLSFQFLDLENLASVGAGAYLIALPGLRQFADLVAHVSARVLVNEDWTSSAEHLPTRKDLGELVFAIVKGNKTKRIGLLVGLFFLSGFITLFAVVFYVVGLRKAFDHVEGWLLDRSASATSESPTRTADDVAKN